MFNSFFESLYLKVIVSIITSPTKTTVYIESCNKKGLVSSVQETFEETKLTQKIHTFIDESIKETPYYYIAILDSSTGQGVVPACAKNEIAYYCDINASEHKCYKNDWTYYTQKTDLYALEKKYDKIGIDYIFSPFVLLANFFKDKIDTALAMYILVEESCISISVFKDSKLLFGEYIDIDMISLSVENLIDDSDKNIDLNDIDLGLDDTMSIDLDSIENDDNVDDFSDIADLDSIEDLEEFSDTKDVTDEDSLAIENEENEDMDLETKNEDYQRFTLIQESVAKFYKDEKFSSEFIENVFIADSVEVSSDLKKYLEEEMFFNVYLRQIDLGQEICEIVKKELS